MKGSVVAHLVLKDWRLQRLLVSLSIGVGVVSLVLTQFGAEVIRLLGSVWFFVSLCVLGSMLPGVAIVNERKKQTLAFIMSLPITSVQYSIAKAISSLAMFIVPWLALLISALVVIETRHFIPHGVIPMLLILAMLPLIGFCLIGAAAMVGESEGWLMAASLVCNSSYWFVWYLLSRIPTLTANWKGPVAVWNPAALAVLSAELGFVILIMGITFFLQSRKRDFI